MDTSRLLELLAHYLVMLILVFGALALLRSVVGPLSFWLELVVVIVIAFAYRPLVLRLGIAPDAWTDRQP